MVAAAPFAVAADRFIAASVWAIFAIAVEFEAVMRMFRIAAGPTTSPQMKMPGSYPPTPAFHSFLFLLR